MQDIEQRISEAFDALWDQLVDPLEPYCDGGDEQWLDLQAANPGSAASGMLSEPQHREIRRQCRQLALVNEFAINAHENRISYIVGTGHTVRAAARKGIDVPDELPARVQDMLDAFIRENAWHRRQQEIVRRLDRDGEVFIRFFFDDGLMRIRFVEPDQVATPARAANDASASFGVQTEPRDVETPLGYWIDGEWVAASLIQHRKANVDANVKRGLPLLHPVRKNLRRAEKLLRNMSVVSEIQSAIALIRRHRSATRDGVERFVSNSADASANSGSGRVRHFRQYAPGTILDAPAGLEYDFPAAGVDAANFVTVLQTELRAVASRLVMPEFMFTSDASNASYSSTMVAEGPAVKMFERLQAAQVEADRELLWRAVEAAVRSGRLPSEVRDAVEIQIAPPSLATRDRVDEARTHQIAYEAGILSPQTWAGRLGLDYDQEQRNLAAARALRDENRGSI